MMRERRGSRWIAAVCIGCIMPVPLVLWQDGFHEEVLRSLARGTARISFVFFAGAFFATTLRRFYPSRIAQWLVTHRRPLGVAFAFLHAGHMVVIALLARLGADLGVSAYSVGWPALFFIFLMAVTSNDASQRSLGIAWKRIHLFGGYLVAYVFGLSFLPSIQESVIALILFATLCLGVLGRVAARILVDRESANPRTRTRAIQDATR